MPLRRRAFAPLTWLTGFARLPLGRLGWSAAYTVCASRLQPRRKRRAFVDSGCRNGSDFRLSFSLSLVKSHTTTPARRLRHPRTPVSFWGTSNGTRAFNRCRRPTQPATAGRAEWPVSQVSGANARRFWPMPNDWQLRGIQKAGQIKAHLSITAGLNIVVIQSPKTQPTHDRFSGCPPAKPSTGPIHNVK